MKHNYNGIPPIGGGVVGSIQTKITPRAPSTGYTQKAPNNYRKNTGPFPQTDALIRSLDAKFHELPTFGPDWGNSQEAWDHASIYYSPWKLCGCRAQHTDGQTLHRNWNLNRVLLLLDYIDAPILEATGYYNVSGLVADVAPPDPPAAINLIGPFSPNAYWIIITSRPKYTRLILPVEPASPTFPFWLPPTPDEAASFADYMSYGPFHPGPTTLPSVLTCSLTQSGRPMDSYLMLRSVDV